MITYEQIKNDVAALGIPDGAIVLMHTSLRAIGKMECGAEGLLDALVENITSRGGLLCVPTHTWDNLSTPGFTLDVIASESCLGAFPNVALADPRGIRSENPTHSMVVFGDKTRAEEFIKGELTVKTPTSPDSCYGRLRVENGYILLVGVTQNSNTYLHSIEELLDYPNRVEKTPTAVSVKREDGSVYSGEMYLFDESVHGDVSHKFYMYEPAFRHYGAIRDGKIGAAATQLCDAAVIFKAMERLGSRAPSGDPLMHGDRVPEEFYI